MTIDNTIRKLLIAAVALALLLVAGVILNLTGRQSTPTIALAPARMQNEVSWIDLSKGDAHVSLFRDKDDTWMVRGDFNQPAVTQKVKDLLASIYGLQAERKVASGTSQDSDLGLADANAIHLVLRDGKTVVISDYQFSERNIDNSSLVRLGTDATVWQVRGVIAPQLKTQLADWVDKRLFPGIAFDAVREFSVEHQGSGKTHFLRDSGKKTWKGTGSPDALKAGDQEIPALLRQITGLEGDKLKAVDEAGYQAAFQGLEKSFTLTLNTESAITVELWRKKADVNGDYLVKPLPERHSLDGKILLLGIPAFRVGELKVQVAAPPPVAPKAK